MIVVIGFLVLGLFAYSVVMLLASIFSPPRRPKLRKSGLAFLGSIVALIVMVSVPINTAQPTKKLSSTAPASVERAVESVSSSPQAVEPIPIPPPAQDSYISRLDQEINGIASVDAKDYTNDAASLTIGLALIQAWVQIYNEGASIGLTNEQEAKRQHFKTLISKKQVQMLPVFRDSYGPIMRQALWEADGKARTFGKGFRTVEFVNGAFAANRNIKQVHESIYPMLMMLRFTRAEYKWIPQAREFSYYTLKPPQDDQLVNWNANGSFSLVN